MAQKRKNSAHELSHRGEGIRKRQRKVKTSWSARFGVFGLAENLDMCVGHTAATASFENASAESDELRDQVWCDGLSTACMRL